MTFQIRDISQVKPTPGRLYFLDANVWIHKLAGTPPPRAKSYPDFFDALTELTDGTEPVIVATSLLIAYTFNAHLSAGFRLYQSQNPAIGATNLKRNYRPT